ncbi:MAG: ABC transporter ATP-binding protein [Tissierellia bacterium]|nr:ABC transporter ATP-binding protein [Tissierellia bacterium]
MSNLDNKKNDGLPNIERGVGGAGRVQGLLGEEKASNTKGTLFRLLKTVRPFKLAFLSAIILTLIGTISQVIAPYLVGNIITTITGTVLRGQSIQWHEIFKIMTVLVVLYIVRFIAIYWSNLSMVKITQKIVASLRNQIAEKLNNLPLNFFDTSSQGDITSLLTNDLDNILNTLQTGLTSSISALVMMTGVFIMMLFINPILTIVSVIVLPVSSRVVKAIIKKSKPIFQRNAATTGRLNGQVEEALQGEEIVRYYAIKKDLEEEIKELNESLFDTEWRSQLSSFMARPAGDLMLNIDYVIICILGGYYVMNGTITIGNFQAFISYTKMFTSPFQQVLGIMNTIMGALASAERIYEFLDEEEGEKLGENSFDISGVQGGISFDKVDFSYVPEKSLFTNYSLDIDAGEQIAIVGTTGAGKTTFVNLLMRFYEIQNGTISLDGKDISSYDVDEYRKGYAMVLQDTWLFEGTIRENIAYGAQLSNDGCLMDIPMEDIKEAARMASADGFIKRLPKGYDTVLTEGATNISQGQRQLLTIARAIIKHAPIIILDEATSSVDTHTELLIQRGMKALTFNRTSFIIAHRLSTIRDADRILVMEKGSIIESGSHEELIKKDGAYKKLYQAGQMA